MAVRAAGVQQITAVRVAPQVRTRWAAVAEAAGQTEVRPGEAELTAACRSLRRRVRTRRPRYPRTRRASVLGFWTNISPPQFAFDDKSPMFTQGMTIDPCNPATVYVAVVGVTPDFQTVPGGVFRTTDAGATWLELGAFEEPLNVRVDPADPLHLYVVDGVRGSTNGFWVSKDGGKTWKMPDGFKIAAQAIHSTDVYHVEPDPADFNHVLLSFHGAWSKSGTFCEDYGFGSCTSGIFESTDGGTSWKVHDPNPAWSNAGGFDVFFLYKPEAGIGDAKTWLFGTQGKGYFRTTDAGQTWKQVTGNSMDHGGAQIYYGKDGTLYVTGTPKVMKSTDNGATWTNVGIPDGNYLAVAGGSARLFSGQHFTGGVMSAKESALDSWAPYGTQPSEFKYGGPFQMAFDGANSRLYVASTGAGLWATKVTE